LFYSRLNRLGFRNDEIEMIMDKCQFSEFSYGYCVTEDLIVGQGMPLTAAPVFPSLVDEGQASDRHCWPWYSYDTMLQVRIYNVWASSWNYLSGVRYAFGSELTDWLTHMGSTHIMDRALSLVTILLATAGVFSIAWNTVVFIDSLNPSSPRLAELARRHSPTGTGSASLPGLDGVAALQWFGTDKDLASESTQRADSLARLELKGISRSSDRTLVGAFIAIQGGPEGYFRIGDRLPANSGTVAGVFSDHVDISVSNNRIIQLRFPKH
jgi:Type II secretion system protein C